MILLKVAIFTEPSDCLRKSMMKQTFQVLTGYFEFYIWKNDSATAAYRAATTNKN